MSERTVTSTGSHFPVYLNSDVANQTLVEIVDVSEDGEILVYTDVALASVGFIDIADPANPQAAGTSSVAKDPLSVAVTADFALVGVDTSASVADPSGHLEVVRISDRTVVHNLELGGHPDARLADYALRPRPMHAMH